MRKTISIIISIVFLANNASFALSPGLKFNSLGQEMSQRELFELAEIGLQADLRMIDKVVDIDETQDIEVIREAFLKHERLKTKQSYQGVVKGTTTEVTAYFNLVQHFDEYMFTVPVSVKKAGQRKDYKLIFSTKRDADNGYPITLYEEKEGQRERDAAQETKETYDRMAEKYAEVRGKNPEGSDLELIIKFSELVKERGKEAGSSKPNILDVGTGLRDLSWLSEQEGLTVEGIDISEKTVDFIRESGKALDVSHMDMTDLKYDDESFTGVRFSASLLHLPLISSTQGADLAISEAYRVLKPEGVTFITVKAETETEKGFMSLDTKEGLGKRYYQFYSKDMLRSILERNGFNLLGNVEEREPRPGVKELYVFAEKPAAKTNTIKTTDSARKFWDKKVKSGLKGERLEDRKYIETILDNAPSKSSKILTLGEGPFIIDVQPLVEAGHNVLATDFSGEAIEVLRRNKEERNLDRLEAERLDFRSDFELPDDEYDMVTSRLSIGNYDSDSQFEEILQRIKRVLKKNGKSKLVFQVKTTKDSSYGKGREIAEDFFVYKDLQLKELDHYSHFWKEEKIRKILNKCGFKISAINEYDKQIYKAPYGIFSLMTVVAEIDDASSLVREAVRSLPQEYMDNGINQKALAKELKDTGGVQIDSTKIDERTAFIFSEKATFDNGLGVLLPKLVKAGIKIAVIARNDKERQLIEELNNTELVGEKNKIICADNVIEATSLVKEAVRFYYFKLENDPEESLPSNVNLIDSFVVKQIIDAIGKASGLDIGKIERLHEAARQFAIAA